MKSSLLIANPLSINAFSPLGKGFSEAEGRLARLEAFFRRLADLEVVHRDSLRESGLSSRHVDRLVLSFQGAVARAAEQYLAGVSPAEVQVFRW